MKLSTLFAAAQARAGGQGTVTVSTWNGKPAAYKTVPRSSPRTVAAEDKMVRIKLSVNGICWYILCVHSIHSEWLSLYVLFFCAGDNA